MRRIVYVQQNGMSFRHKKSKEKRTLEVVVYSALSYAPGDRLESGSECWGGRRGILRRRRREGNRVRTLDACTARLMVGLTRFEQLQVVTETLRRFEKRKHWTLASVLFHYRQRINPNEPVWRILAEALAEICWENMTIRQWRVSGLFTKDETTG